MCGIFGFITRQGEGPEMARLRRLALITQSRGMHAFGLAWLEEGGAIQTFKAPGPAEAHLDELDRCQNAVIVIGHCRYATHGSPDDNRNNHPHVAGAGVIMHNGVVFNHRQLAWQYDLQLQSQCDSEVLGHLMARCPGTINHRAVWAAEKALGDLAILGLWQKPARLLVARRGRPLHVGPGRAGWYFASLPDGLPGRVQPIADRTTRVLRYEGGVLGPEGQPIELATGGGFRAGQPNHLNILKIMDL